MFISSSDNVTHHFKVAGRNDQVVNDIINLCDQGQDGGLKAGRDQNKVLLVKVNNKPHALN